MSNIHTFESKRDRAIRNVRENIAEANEAIQQHDAAIAEAIKPDDLLNSADDFDALCECLSIHPMNQDVLTTAAHVASVTLSAEQRDTFRKRMHAMLDAVLDLNFAESEPDDEDDVA